MRGCLPIIRFTLSREDGMTCEQNIDIKMDAEILGEHSNQEIKEKRARYFENAITLQAPTG